MNEYLSRKIKILSFIAIILVVLLHAYTVGDNDVIMCDISYNSFIQYLFSQGVTRIAVPLFFLISGYLFFRNIPNAKFSDFIKKYKSRFHTLFIPFMFWSILSLIFYILLSVIINIFIPSLHEFRSDIILIKIFQYIFITPIAFQLWFLRDLIVLVIVSPIIYIY
jgi:surface polysaccharide O-acyltransferase-like enzyme